MSRHAGSQRGLLLLVTLTGALAATLALGLGVGSIAAETAEEPDLECVGSGGGAVYVTDTGLTVYENDTDIFYGTPGADTISFQNGLIEFSAAGTAEARLENASGPVCLGDVDAADNDISVTADGATDVTLSGAFDGFAVGDVDTSADTSVTDFAYENESTAALSLDETDLDDGTTVVARDVDTESELDSGTVDGGVVVFDDLPGGAYDVDVASEDELASAEFRRTNLSVSPQQIAPNESVEVSIDIENVGDASGTYGIAVEVDGERRVVEVGESLAPGEKTRDSTSVSFDDTGEYEIGVIGVRDEPRTQTVTVTEPEANVSITEYDLSTTELSVNETLSVTATAANDGDAAGNLTVPLTVDGETVAEETVEVAADGTATVEFERTFETAGDYSLAVGDLDPTTVTVTEPSATLTVTDYDLNATNVTVGETLAIEATVENTGDAAGTLDVPLTLDGETVATETVDVDADDTETVGFEQTFETAGNYSLAAGDLEPTTVTVTAGPDEPSVTDYADDETGVVETEGLRDAIADWRADVIETDLLREVIAAWRSDEPVENATTTSWSISAPQ